MLQRIHIDKGATLFKLPGHPVWYLDLCARGMRTRKTLRTANKEQALTIGRRLVQELLYESWGIPQLREITFREFLEEYRETCKTLNADKTYAVNLPTLELFLGFLEGRHKRTTELKLADVIPRDVEAFQAWRKAHPKITKRGAVPVSPATVNRAIGVVSAFFNLAKKKGYVRINPAADLSKLKMIKRVHSIMDEDQIPKLLHELGRPFPLLGPGKKGNGRTKPRLMPLRDVAILILETGLRLGEALYLKWEDIDLKRRVLTAKCRDEYTVKDREERRIGLNDGALSVLTRRQQLGGPSPWVFSSQNGTPIDQRNALRMFKKAARAIGLAAVNFYTLRHTFATRSAMTLPPFVLMQIMGHSSVRTTERYYVHGQSWYKTEIPPCISGEVPG